MHLLSRVGCYVHGLCSGGGLCGWISMVWVVVAVVGFDVCRQGWCVARWRGVGEHV